MSLNSLILTTLKPTGVPVAFQVYGGTASTYITFFEVVDVPSMHSDNELDNSMKTMQVDIWSTGNYATAVSDVKRLMKEAGFLWTSSRELYESDTKKYHYVLEYKKNIKITN